MTHVIVMAVFVSVALVTHGGIVGKNIHIFFGKNNDVVRNAKLEMSKDQAM